MTTNPYQASRVPEPLVVPQHPSSGTATDVEFELTLEDYVAFNHEHMERMFAMRAIRLALALIGGLSVPLGVAIYLLSQPTALQLKAFLIFWAVVNFLVFVGIAIWWYRSAPLWGTDWFIRWYATRGDASGIFGRYRIMLAPREIL